MKRFEMSLPLGLPVAWLYLVYRVSTAEFVPFYYVIFGMACAWALDFAAQLGAVMDV